MVTRKSTTGFAAMVGKHCLKHGSSTQAMAKLSSGESEYSAAVKCGSVGIGLKSMYEDYGKTMELEIQTDSSTAYAIASRRGVGRLRHLNTRLLWLQQHVYHKTLVIKKISTKVNVADLFTKHLGAERMEMLMNQLGFYFKEGRSKVAKQMLK